MKNFFVFLFISFAFIDMSIACETFTGFTLKADMCWNENLKSFISKSCEDKCDALGPFKTRGPARVPELRINTSVLACEQVGAEVIVLADKDKNEMSFCEFKDGSLRDASSMELLLK